MTAEEGLSTELYVAHRARLVAIAWMILGSREAAEDAVQDAFVKIAGRSFASIEDPFAYVRTVVVNTCRRTARTTRWGDIPLVAEVHDPGRFDEHDVEMFDALSRLTPRRRAAIVLRYYEGLPVTAIAELLGATPGTVSSLIHRATRDLKDLLP